MLEPLCPWCPSTQEGLELTVVQMTPLTFFRVVIAGKLSIALGADKPRLLLVLDSHNYPLILGIKIDLANGPRLLQAK